MKATYRKHHTALLCQFADAECAKKALEQLNGFELAGRPMKVGHVTERMDASAASSFLDSDELERTGIDLGTTGRLQLMARLAEGETASLLPPDDHLLTLMCNVRACVCAGTGLQIPPAAQQALQMSGAIAIGAMAAVSGRRTFTHTLTQESDVSAAPVGL